jgi:hypothetical protein
MANMAIIDTGYLTITATAGTQATMANGGSAINLRSVEITFQGGGNIDDSPVINAATTGASNANLNFASITNARIVVTGILDRTVDGDMDLMDDLNDLRKTLGIKLIYYTSTTDGFRDITDSIGSTDSAHLSGTTPHLHVRVTDFTIRQGSDTNILRYTLEMRETA